MEGQLTEHPTAELIREIAEAKLSGALRLSRGRAQSAVYFEKGLLVFAASNLRTHRLSAVLKRSGILNDEQFAGMPARNDEEFASALVQRGLLGSIQLDKLRDHQVSDVLRAVLLWIDGTWKFDPRVRLADELRVRVDVNRLLLESGRHLPESFVTSRFNGNDGTFERARVVISDRDLLPTEAFVLSRAETPVTLSELTTLGGSPREETLRTIYALSLSGLLERSNWSRTLTSVARAGARTAKPGTSAAKEAISAAQSGANAEEIEAQELERFFARLEGAVDHYEVLNVGRLATADEIKSAYHTLARSFHPDRFHRSEPELRSQIDSAFARIAQAYETLSDQSRRAAYDGKRVAQSPKPDQRASANAEETRTHETTTKTEVRHAETSFQTGLKLLRQNRRDEAVRYFAEAASLEPRKALYRAHYGHALIGQDNTRRIAEVELQAALSLEPGNGSYRVMLAELYKALGLRRRAEGELQRALAADPKNEEARQLLSSLRK